MAINICSSDHSSDHLDPIDFNRDDITSLETSILGYLDESQSMINKQFKKIAMMQEQIENLSHDNKELRIQNSNLDLAMSSLKMHKMASEKLDETLKLKAKNLIDQFIYSGFIKSASVNDNTSDYVSDVINNPNKVISLLEDISDTFDDLGLLHKKSSEASNEQAEFFSDHSQVNNKNALNSFETTNRKNLATTSYESNLRDKIANDNYEREEAFLKTLNNNNPIY